MHKAVRSKLLYHPPFCSIGRWRPSLHMSGGAPGRRSYFMKIKWIREVANRSEATKRRSNGANSHVRSRSIPTHCWPDGPLPRLPSTAAMGENADSYPRPPELCTP